MIFKMTTIVSILIILVLVGVFSKIRQKNKEVQETKAKEKAQQAEVDERIKAHPHLYLQTAAYYQQWERAKIDLEISNLSEKESQYIRNLNKQLKNKKISYEEYQEALRVLALEKLQWCCSTQKENPDIQNTSH